MADWNPVPLPFSKASSQLPGPLPTENEILEAKDVLSTNASANSVVAVGTHYVAKHGAGLSETEGQTLLFLEKYCRSFLKSPKLFAMYRLKSTGHLCLVMEKIPGENLEELWPKLEEDEKTVICAQLRESMTSLRRIPCPGFYGGVGKTMMPYYLFWNPERKQEICGPFGSEHHFNAGLVNKFREDERMNEDSAISKVKFYRRHIDTMLGSHHPVFTHSDLQRKNILVFRHSRHHLETAIVDWEVAGWYPSYWEYAVRIVTMIWTEAGDWPERLEQILDPWPREVAVLRMIYQDCWF